MSHHRGIVSSGLFYHVSFLQRLQTYSRLTLFTFGDKWDISYRMWLSSAETPLTALAIPQQETERRREQLSARKTLNAEQMWTLGKQHDCLSWQIYYCDGEVPWRLFERRTVNHSCWYVPWQAASSMNAASLPFSTALGSTINIMHPSNPHAKQHLLLSPLLCRKWEDSRRKWGRKYSVERERGTSHPALSLRPWRTEVEQKVRGQCPYWAE